jgi:hypothetical protein
MMVALEPGSEWTPELKGWLAVRLEKGAAYWQSGGRAPTQMETGDVIHSACGMRGRLLASRISVARLQWVVLEPGVLRAIANLGEGLELETLASDPAAGFEYHPAGSDAARKFDLLARLPAAQPLVNRCRWLHWWTETLSPRLKGTATSQGTDQATGRF